jgi:hypothetical protein
MNPIRPSTTAVFLLGLAAAGPAHALSCEEILAMVDVGVPNHIVVQTIDDSGGLFGDEELHCLVLAEAPEPVLAQVRSMLREPPGVTPLPPRMETEAETEPEPLGTGRSLSDGDEDRDATPTEITQAIRLIRARKPMSASLALHGMLAEDRYPDHRGQLALHMGRALQALDMPQSAQAWYLTVLKRGPADPYFEPALARLVALAEASGDMTELSRVVARLPVDTWPRRAEPTLAYLLGVRQLEQGELERARATLAAVPTHSPHGLQARYIEGVILARQGRAKSAVRSFREVIQVEVRAHSRAEAHSQRDLKNLALVDVARIHYGLELFERAEALYGEVEPESSAWTTARLELAWAQFMQNDSNGSLGQILTVRSPYFTTDPFLPEAEILRALNHFTLCEYDEVDRILVAFEERIRPQQQELQAFARGYASAEGRKLADQAWATYFDDFPQDSVLDQAIFEHLLKDRDLVAQVTRLEAIERELALIGQQKLRWRDAVGPDLVTRLEEDRQRTRRRAGLLLLAGVAELSIELRDLLAQSEIIRFEASDATRIIVEELIVDPHTLGAVAEFQEPYASAGEIHWPFNGEFWEDELGSYRYLGEGICR